MRILSIQVKNFRMHEKLEATFDRERTLVAGPNESGKSTLADAIEGGLSWRDVPAYVLTQVVGAVLGVVLAHLMFSLPMVTYSTHERTGPAQWLAELVATFGLLATIFGVSRRTPAATPF